jgi:hypothetical protein
MSFEFVKLKNRLRSAWLRHRWSMPVLFRLARQQEARQQEAHQRLE